MKLTHVPFDIDGRDGTWYVRLTPSSGRTSAVGEFAGQALFGRQVTLSTLAGKLTVQVQGDLAQACQTGTCLMLLEELYSGYRN